MAVRNALKLLYTSRDPEAIAFLRTMVVSKEAHTDRLMSLTAICANGTDRDRDFAAGLAPRRTLLPPLIERIAPGGNLDASGGYVRGTYEDAKTGKTWDLLSSFVLGGGLTDLFIAEKDGAAWKTPVFLGIGIGSKNIDPSAGLPASFTGMSELDFYTKKHWTQLIDYPPLRTDADGDGLPDRLEARLGTDPTRKDTDGDGDDDLADPWPKVARRAATDEERILASALGYGYFRDPPSCPVVWANEVEPFELWGWSAPCFHGTGAAREFARFGYTVLTFLPLPGKKGVEAVDFVGWNADRSEATVGMKLQFSEDERVVREFRFRKYGKGWLPVRYVLKAY